MIKIYKSGRILISKGAKIRHTCGKYIKGNSICCCDSLDDGLGEEDGIAGLGGMVEHGLPIFDGGLNPDGFGSVMLCVFTITQPAIVIIMLIKSINSKYIYIYDDTIY